jgi:hypothetical protein
MAFTVRGVTRGGKTGVLRGGQLRRISILDLSWADESPHRIARRKRCADRFYLSHLFGSHYSPDYWLPPADATAGRCAGCLSSSAISLAAALGARTLRGQESPGYPAFCRRSRRCRSDPAAAWRLPAQRRQTGPGIATMKESRRAFEGRFELLPCGPRVPRQPMHRRPA